MKKRLSPPQKRSHDLVAQPRGQQILVPEVGSVHGEPYNEKTEGGLLEYWEIVRRRKGTILIFAVLGAVSSLLLSLPKTPIYRASTSVEILVLNDNFLNLAEVSPTAIATANTDISTQVEILESRFLLSRVVQRLELDKQFVPSDGADRISKWRKALHLVPPSPVPAMQQALEAAAESLTVEPSRTSRIVTIYSEWPDPLLAADFANALAEEFIDQGVEARWEATRRTGEWLGRQLEDLRTSFQKSEERLQNYARATGLMFTSPTESVAEQKLSQLQQELSNAQADRIVKQSRNELGTSGPTAFLAELFDNAPLREYQLRLSMLRRELAELRSFYTPAHYMVKRVEAQILETESTLEKERSNILERIEADYEAALRRETLLEKAYGSQAELVSQQADSAIQYNIYKQEVETNRQLYDTLLQKVKEAGVAAAMSGSHVRVIDPAVAPLFPESPNHLRDTILGLLSGFFLGVVFVFIRDQTDHTLKKPGDIAEQFNLLELGAIPNLPMNKAPAKSRRDMVVSARRRHEPEVHPNGSASSLCLASGVESALPECVELVTWNDGSCLAAECFRTTLASILFATGIGQRPKVLVIVSPTTGEGKSTVVSNLGVMLGEIGQRVLIVDADTRKARQHKIFGVPNTWGLTDLLREQSNISELAAEQIGLETRVPGLFLLPSGRHTNSMSRLFYSVRVAEVLKRARTQFDFVLIDTPPLLQIADARVMAQLADAAVLVTRAGKTTRESTKAAVERLRTDGVTLLGMILNGWNPKIGGYGYYDYASTSDLAGQVKC